jgi:Holliday junction resolvase RusA-like endonuclease
MKRTEFEIPGVPGHWARAGSRSGVRFTTRKTRSWEAKVATCAAEAFDHPTPDSVRLTVLAVYPRPKELAFVYKKTGEPKHPIGRLWKSSSADLSNVIKAIEDALNGLAFVDDRQVVAYGSRTGKVFARMWRDDSSGAWVQEPPHVEVVIERLGEVAQW